MIFSDIHVHTTICDGKSTPEEIVKKAIEMGYEAIGFSGHSYTDFDDGFCMECKDIKLYREELERIRAKYPEFDIFIGIERDYYSSENDNYDYVIGSLHYVVKDGIFMNIDSSVDKMKENVENYFGGNYREYVKYYYDNLKDVVEKTGADVIGHFDLITKFNEGDKFFDTDSQWYREIVLDALRCVTKHKPIFEVNTGAVCRGYRTEPYPAKFILEEIKKSGCDIIITSDCHFADNLGYGFDKAIEYAKECGFDKVKVITANGFEYRNI